MQDYVFIAAAFWLLIKALGNISGKLAGLAPILWWGVGVFALLAVVIGAGPLVSNLIDMLQGLVR